MWSGRKTITCRAFGMLFLVLCLIGGAVFVSDMFNGKITKATAPTVTGISPDNGPIAGGTKITIEGSGFLGQYEQVEYIHFDGASYIQTDVAQRSSGVVKNMNVRVKPDVFDKIRFVAGAANSSGQQIFAVEQFKAASYRFYAGSGAAAATPSTGTATLGSITATGMIDIAFDSVRTYHINGSMGTAVGGAPTADSYYQIAGTEGKTNDTNMNYFKGNFYMLKLTDGTTSEVLNHLVPAREKSTGDYGVVDLITGSFYDNSGNGTITGGAVVSGSLAPDRPISVTIDGRACTGVEVISNTELTCHTPSGLSLGKKDVIVSNTLDSAETTTITDGYEYALRLNSILPKFGDPDVINEIEIEGGVFSTPPDSYVSASESGIQFDGDSWIAPGFDQIGSTSYMVDFKLPSSAAALNTGFIGSRSTGSSGSFLVWELQSGQNFRFDYGNSGGSTAGYSGLLGVRSSIKIDDGYVKLNETRVSDRTKLNFSSELPAEMLLGSLTTGSGYGTNSFSAYKNFGGVIYSAQICKEKTIAQGSGVIYQESSLCDGPSDSANNSSRPERVLVRDLQAAIRASDNVCGFYDMVTGEFLTNAGYGTLTCTKDVSDNILEVPVELEVTFTYFDDNDAEQTGVCSNPVLLSTTKLKCTMPVSSLPGDGQGKVDLTVYANEVEATAGTADANDFYYGSPMVVETISPNRGTINGGQTVTIAGNNFYPPNYDVATFDPITEWANIELTIGGSVCEFELDANNPTQLANPDHYTNTSITCTTTANPGGISDIEATLEYFDEEDQDTKTTTYLYGGALDPISGAITSGYLYEDQLLSVDPIEGPTIGGTVVTIYGNNFLTSGTTTRVYFGGRQATNVSVAADGGSVTATTPANVPGKVDILVSQEGYAASLSRLANGAFEYYVSESDITLTPNRGYTTGGETIIITGEFDTSVAAEVTFGGVAATNVTVLNTSQIQLTTPAHAAGRATVVVKQYGLPVGTATNGFTYIPPLSIADISPDRGSITGGTLVTITGQSFIPIGSTATLSLSNLSVTIGGVACTVASVDHYTDTMIKCTTGAHVSGLVDVVVTNGAGSNQTATLTAGYRYILSELSLSAQSINITLNPVMSTIGANNTLVRVQTDNLDGYTVKMRADDSDGTTSNDNWLKCNNSGSTAKLETISVNGPITDNKWGWNIDSTASSIEPSTWKPVSTSDVQIAASLLPSGPSNDGQDVDTHQLWFGAKANLAQPACTYSAILVISAVANGI